MTRRPVKNIAASVRQRLLNIARERGRRFDDILQHYASERWLYRLSRSEHARRFVLKGALMLTAWNIPVTRPTRDIDLLVHASNDLDSVCEMIKAICLTPIEDDGIVFESESVATVRIVENADYEGVRATFRGWLDTARIAMQVDISFSDVVTPSPVEITYPTILEMPAPKLGAYNRETAIAEKFETMVKIGELNSRMKDFFDVWTLARSGEFDGPALAATIKKTFMRRCTAMDSTAVCFTDVYALSDVKEAQWTAFVKRTEIKDAPSSFTDVWSSTMAFLRPVANAVEDDRLFDMHWPADGPWQAKP